MKCVLCKKMLRADNKSGVCSNCGAINLSALINKGIIELASLKTSKENSPPKGFKEGICKCGNTYGYCGLDIGYCVKCLDKMETSQMD